ncbi:hypothetical protein J3B00_003353 [Pseudomonas sp. BP8]|nr:hypothetical protein [Pseudomonas sp. BP8]
MGRKAAPAFLSEQHRGVLREEAETVTANHSRKRFIISFKPIDKLASSWLATLI